MKQRFVVIPSICLFASGALGAAFYFTGPASAFRRGASAPTTQSAHAAESVADANIAPFSRTGWEAGVTYVQAIDLVLGISSAAKEDGSSPPLFKLHLRGTLQSLVSEVHGSEVRARLKLIDPKVDVSGSAAPPEVTRAFATQFFADYDAHGRALRVHVTPGLDRIVQGLLRELVSSTQISTTESGMRSWVAVESDTSGDYKATYRALSANKVMRQKTEYVRLFSRGGDASTRPQANILASGAEFELDDWGRVTALTSKFHVNISAGTTGLAFDSHAELTLKTLSRSRDATGLPLSIAGLVTTPIADESNAQGPTNIDRELVAGADVKGILAGLTEAKDEGQTASHARTRLAALFRLDSGAVDTALRTLNAENAPTILAAMGSAGTPVAEKAVRGVLSDGRRSPEERLAAVDSVFGMEHPSLETATALEALKRSDNPTLKQNASLALGVAAARISETDPAAGQGVVKRLADDYPSAKTSDEQIRVLGALGNARSSDSLAVLTQAMGSSDPAVRTAAAAALRFVPDAAADSLLAKALTSDPELSVRLAALMAAGYRAYDPLAQALEATAKDPDANLRAPLVSTLAQMARQENQALVLLDWMANNDPSSEVRARAKVELTHLS